MWKIEQELRYNSKEFETTPLIKTTGFREYDARWQYPEQINILGLQCFGAGLATDLLRLGHNPPRVVVGHDYRSYSASVKQALMVGLLSAGCEVHDIGLATTPMAYFAQFELGVPGLAMVTASHNENGWTGVKVGSSPPLTYGPEEVKNLRRAVMGGDYARGSGTYYRHDDLAEKYLEDLSAGKRLKKKLRVVVAAGNGTAGAFAPAAFSAIGCDVIAVDCDLDFTFPRYNPNPEDLEALQALKEAVLEHKADLGLGFDGDGDRCGVVDDRGENIFSDKMGLLIARELSGTHAGAGFIVDVKSTGLFKEDAVLQENNASVEYWITGHSYMKKRLHDTGALAAFEKSGHFIFAPPIGRGYDDGLLSGLMVCQLLDDTGKKLSSLREELPVTWQTPTMGRVCPDESKYELVERVRAQYEDDHRSGRTICGEQIRDILTVNGVRVTLSDGTWGLIRASSNKPSLVIVAESPVSRDAMKLMFEDMDRRLDALDGPGVYDQSIP